MLSFRRALIVVVVSAAALYLTSGGGLAAGNPGRVPNPVGDLSGTFCGQPILLHVVVNQEFVKSFATKDGGTRLEIDGRLVVAVINSQKTLMFNASGPGTVILAADQSLVSVNGRGQVFLITNNGGLFLINGLALFDASGNLVSVNGHVTDICALLA